MDAKRMRNMRPMDFIYVKGVLQRFYRRNGDWVATSGGVAHRESCELPSPILCNQTHPDGSIRQVKIMVPEKVAVSAQFLSNRIMIREEVGKFVMTCGDMTRETQNLMSDIQTFVQDILDSQQVPEPCPDDPDSHCKD